MICSYMDASRFASWHVGSASRQGCSLISGLSAQEFSLLAMMESAGEVLLFATSSQLRNRFRLLSPRSDLFRHHLNAIYATFDRTLKSVTTTLLPSRPGKSGRGPEVPISPWRSCSLARRQRRSSVLSGAISVAKVVALFDELQRHEHSE